MYKYNSGCAFNTLGDIAGKKVTVMGLGLNGGGEAAVIFLLKHKALVTATDLKDANTLRPTIEKIEAATTKEERARLVYRLGEHKEEDFSAADVVLKNPIVDIETNKYLRLARVVETDINIFLHFTPSPIIAVTGSKGKSSTVSALYYGLNACGVKCFLGGNITISPLTFLEETTKETPVILELSSWQLRDLYGRGTLKPSICLITKIARDHQNWYKDMESYVRDKKILYEAQGKDGISIFDSDKWGEEFAREARGKVYRYNCQNLLYNSKNTSDNSTDCDTRGKRQEGSKRKIEEAMKKAATYGAYSRGGEGGEWEGYVLLPGMKEAVCLLKEPLVLGQHIRGNLLNASLIMLLMGLDKDKISSCMNKWKGVPHRLELFYRKEILDKRGEKIEIEFFNDSAATVPEAAIASINSFNKGLILLLGGNDKRLDFTALLDCIEKKVKEGIIVGVYILAGDASDKIASEADKRGIKYKGKFNKLEEMIAILKEDILEGRLQERKEGEEEGRKIREEGGKITVLFSPGATSFRMFENEFDRGDKYMKAIKEVF